MNSTPLLSVVRLVVPVTVMIAAAVLIKGYASSGDGFSAGVIVSLGALLLYAALGVEATERLLPMQHAIKVAIAGLLIALAVAFVPVALGEPIFTHAPAPGSKPIYIGTLELITAFAFDIGVFLLVAGSVIAMLRVVAMSRPASGSAER